MGFTMGSRRRAIANAHADLPLIFYLLLTDHMMLLWGMVSMKILYQVHACEHSCYYYEKKIWKISVEIMCDLHWKQNVEAKEVYPYFS